MHKVQVTPLIGLPQFDGWAHVATGAAGHVVWVLAVSGQHARNVGKDLLDTIQSEEVETSAACYRLVQDIVRQAQAKDAQLSLSTAFFEHEKAVFFAYNGLITLRRQGKVGQLLTAHHDLRVLEGDWQPDDLYILFTQQAAQFLGEIQQKMQQGFESDTIVTSITPNLHLQDSTALSALAFIKQLPPRDAEAAQAPIEISLDEEESSSLFSVQREPGELEQIDQELTSQEQGDFPTESVQKQTSVFPVVAEGTTLLQSPFLPESTFSDQIAGDQITGGRPSTTDGIPQFLTQQPFATDQGLTEPVATGAGMRARPNIVSWWPLLQSQLSNLGQSLTKVGSKVLALGSAVARGVRAGQARFSWQYRFLSPFSQDVYVSRPTTRKLARYVVLVLIIGGVVATWVGYAFNRRSTQIAALTAQLTPFQSERETIRNQVDADPISARQKVSSIITQLEEMLTSTPENMPGRDKIEAELQAAQALYESISGKEEFNQLPVFFDLQAVTQMVVTDAELLESQAAFYDAGQKVLVILNLETKEAVQRDVATVADVLDMAARPDNNTLWFLGKSISQIRVSSSEEATQMIKEDVTELAGAKLLSTFGDALYVLNPQERTIFRFSRDDDGFEAPVRWLKSAPDLEFNDVASMAIDGDLWLTTHQGRIIQLRSGNQQEFSVSGLETPLNSSITLYTTADLENLYVLEPSQYRLVVLTKEGQYLREIKSASLASATAVVVSETRGKALVSDGSIIYEIGL